MMREQDRGFEHRHGVLDQHDAVAPQPGVAQTGVPGERPRVRHDRAQRRLGAALRRADQHRLARGSERVEAASDPGHVAHRLHVGRDHLGVRILGRPREEIAEPQHGLVAHAEDDAEADAAVRRHLVHRPGDGPRLRDHADRSGDGVRGRGGAVGRHAIDVVDESLDVGTEHREVVADRRLAQPLLQRPALVARLREPRRHDHDGTDPVRRALVDHPHDDAGGNDEDDQVKVPRQRRDRRHARDPPDGVVLRVHGVERARVADVA